jgi:hypothetical protein
VIPSKWGFVDFCKGETTTFVGVLDVGKVTWKSKCSTHHSKERLVSLIAQDSGAGDAKYCSKVEIIAQDKENRLT